MFTVAELGDVVPLVRASVPPTLQYAWPLLKAHTGVEIVVKHENHTAIGSLKYAAAIVYFDRLKRQRPQVQGIVTATRGNHGQSLAFAGVTRWRRRNHRGATRELGRRKTRRCVRWAPN